MMYLHFIAPQSANFYAIFYLKAFTSHEIIPRDVVESRAGVVVRLGGVPEVPAVSGHVEVKDVVQFPVAGVVAKPDVLEGPLCDEHP